jgi:hypothetical protein
MMFGLGTMARAARRPRDVGFHLAVNDLREDLMAFRRHASEVGGRACPQKRCGPDVSASRSFAFHPQE